ncbi:MAG: resistance to Congo red protein [Actinomyces sp.]|uniref:resistance to Congo red protein n=1 Tax=Actinomyces sp. TaxID=29317 RepID=UPI0026DC2FCD|nr:resistance to Congo red protein [Actinomyces sp.]MDO4243977.1 resistance to Congo red protein [Actinomyces sp.]
MRPPLRRSLRRLGAAALVPLVLALSACGATYDFTIHENDTVDFVATTWGDEVTEEYCTESSGDSFDSTYTFTEYEGKPACEQQAEAVPLSEFAQEEGSESKITHEGDLYIVVLEISGIKEQVGASAALSGTSADDIQTSVTVTFPGKVTEANGNAEIDGSTVTWNDLLNESETTLRAEGKDSPSNPLPLIIGAIVGVAALIGIIVAIVVASKKKRRGQLPPAGSVPLQPGYQQPGYQAQPGQPGYQQPGPYPQDPQQPYNPGGQGQY